VVDQHFVVVYLNLSTVCHHNLLACLPTLRSKGFNLLDNIHALYHLTKDYMLAVKPASLSCADEKLRSVGVRASISHRQDSWSCVGQLEVFILKLVSINRFTTSTIVSCKISTLAHKVRDYSMEGGALESKSFLTSAQRSEVFGSFGYNIGAKLHQNPSNWGPIRSYVEKYTSHPSLKYPSQAALTRAAAKSRLQHARGQKTNENSG